MKCPRCSRLNAETALRCECGYKFGQVEPDELPGWFDEIRTILETAYLQAGTPWKQSGKSGTFEEWTRLRVSISECIDAPGSLLDVGCANGFLLECLLAWTRLKGVEITPYGLDHSAKLVELAKKRLPQFQDNLFAGNAWDWEPPRRFDYVRTELVYVPENLRPDFVTRLLDRCDQRAGGEPDGLSEQPNAARHHWTGRRAACALAPALVDRLRHYSGASA